MKKHRWTWALLLCALLALSAVPAGAEKPSAEKPRLIAHAGGAVYGFRYTNSLEALDAAYAGGFRYIELDFCLSSDGALVLLHDWEAMALRLLGWTGQNSLVEFLRAETFMDLTLLDGEGLLRWLDEHPDCRIVTDVKAEDNVAALTQLKALAGRRQDAFIPQIYNAGEYEAVTALGYTDVILTLYRLEDVSPLPLLLFVRDHPLWAVTIPQGRLEPELLSRLSRAVPVYAHTVNDLSFYETWRARGLYGIYTDYFQPAHWPALP